MSWTEDRRYYLVQIGQGPLRVVSLELTHERVLASGSWEAMQTARRLLLQPCLP